MPRYELSTRARRTGIYFERDEVRPLGITEGSHCWGLWVDAPGMDERLPLTADSLGVQAPHLVIAPMHPDFWSTAFTLQVMLQVRDVEKEGAEADAQSGLADALSRCGVNVLFIETAQERYRRVRLTATCEFPRLRRAAKKWQDEADKAGQTLHKVRKDMGERRPGEPLDEKLVRANELAYKVRVIAMQDLGRLVLPELAELELRLVLMDRMRYRMWEARRSGEPAMEERVLNDCKHPHMFELLVGQSWSRMRSSNAKRDALRSAVEAPWFLSTRTVEHGENVYGLSYAEVEELERSRRTGERTDADAGEIARASLPTLFKSVLSVLKERPLGERMRRALDPGARSATAERVEYVRDGEEFERESMRDFFRRQAVLPVRVEALAALAEARFWRLGKEQQFYYENRLLHPMVMGLPATMNQVFRTLNGPRVLAAPSTSSGAETKFGKFEGQVAVEGNVDVADRFIRLRFIRELAEEGACATLRLRYRVTKLKRDLRHGPTSQGLLSRAFRVLLGCGLRPERSRNKITKSELDREEGQLEVVGKAFNSAGLELCRNLTENTPGEYPPESKLREWRAILFPRRLGYERPRGEDIMLRAGFVPLDR